MQAKQKEEISNLIPTGVSASYRLKSGAGRSKDKKRVFCVNLRSEAVNHLRLNDKEKPRYVSMKVAPGGYLMTFTDRPNARTIKVPAAAKNNVTIEFNELFFKIDYQEDVKARDCDALMTTDGNSLMLHIDVQEFLDQKALLVARFIDTREQKVEEGFLDDGLWGEALDLDVEEQIKAAQEDYILAKARAIEASRSRRKNVN